MMFQGITSCPPASTLQVPINHAHTHARQHPCKHLISATTHTMHGTPPSSSPPGGRAFRHCLALLLVTPILHGTVQDAPAQLHSTERPRPLFPLGHEPQHQHHALAHPPPQTVPTPTSVNSLAHACHHHGPCPPHNVLRFETLFPPHTATPPPSTWRATSSRPASNYHKHKVQPGKRLPSVVSWQEASWDN